MHGTRDELAAQLLAAFPPAPLDFTKALTGGTDEGAYCRHVQGKTWTELDREYVLYRSDVLSFLEPHHAAAVLPVYLRSLVEDGTKTPVPDTLLLVLDKDSGSRSKKLWRVLDAAQRAVVLESLEIFAASTSGQPADAARHAAASWRSRVVSRSP